MQKDFSQDASFGADTHNSMKALAVLYAGTLSRYALQPVSAGKSAFARCLESASRFPGVSEILVAGSESLASAIPSGLSVPVRTQNPSAPGIASLFELMAAASPGFDSIYFSWADCPYLDVSLTSSLAEKHTRYFAEYTFADGYPYGLTPDILASGIVPIIAKLAQNEQGPITRRILLENLDAAGFPKDDLLTLQKLVDMEKSDLYDVLEYVFNGDYIAMTREARAKAAEATIFALLNDKQKEFITFVLSKYIETGVDELDQEKLPILLTNKYQSLEDAKEILGDVANISRLFIEFQEHLYKQKIA